MDPHEYVLERLHNDVLAAAGDPHILQELAALQKVTEEHQPAHGTHSPDDLLRCQGCGQPFPCVRFRRLARRWFDADDETFPKALLIGHEADEE